PLPLTMFDALGYPSIDGPPEDDGIRTDVEQDETQSAGDGEQPVADPQAEVDDSDADDDPQPSEEDTETTGRPWQLMATPGAEDWGESIFSERTVRLLTDPTFPRDAEIVGEWFIAYV